MNSIVATWLALQCRQIPGAANAIVRLHPRHPGARTTTAYWPEDRGDNDLLDELAARALEQHRTIFHSPARAHGQANEPSAIAAPIFLDGQLGGAIAIEVDSSAQGHEQALQKILEWGANWLELLLRRQDPPQGPDPPRLVLELAADCLERQPFRATATRTITEVATRMRCERVSLGFLGRRGMQVCALSHNARFEPRHPMIRRLEAAMVEAVEQGTTLVYPAPASNVPQASRAHAVLTEHHGMAAACTVPLSARTQTLGALTLERNREQGPFDAQAVGLGEQVAAIIGPLLYLHRQRERPLAARLGAETRARLARIFGPQDLKIKLTAVLLAGLLTVLSLATGEYRATANASLEGAVERVVVAAQDGFLAAVRARPGDVVSEGQLLAALDQKDLELQRLQWSSERAQLAKEYRDALAKHERTQVTILRARMEQATVQLQLLDEQLARTRIVAPLTGIVVSGDLTRELGAPVERGQILFRVAPLDDYRVILHVKEQDIAEIAAGQQGELALAAAPEKPLRVIIERVTPVATARGGHNFFEVTAELATTPEFLRPGMQGVAKIAVDRRRLLWIWGHGLLDWARLWLWSWWPS